MAEEELIHSRDIILTDKSLLAFIGKIHNNIKTNYAFVSTSDMLEKMTITNQRLTDDELEIFNVFSLDNPDYGWNTKYIAKICIINKEYALTGNATNDRSSGRYTWVRGGSLLNFAREISGRNNDNRPIGTIYIDENNGTTTHVVSVKGFDDDGNFSNATSGTINSISTDILNADNGNFSNTVTANTVTATNGNFTNLNITGNNGFSFNGVLNINNFTEASRYSTSTGSFQSVYVGDDNFNIWFTIPNTNNYYVVDSKTTQGYKTYYLLTKVSNSKQYSPSQTFVELSNNNNNNNIGIRIRDNDNAPYYPNNNNNNIYRYDKKVTVVTPTKNIVSKYFKTSSIARQYYTDQKVNFICNTDTNYVNNSYFYKWLGVEPAPNYGIDDNSMNLSGSIVTRGGIAAQKSIKGYRVHGAVFNDYAEFRHTNDIEPGRCVIETGKGDLILSQKRLQLGANIVSDTYGFSIGENNYSNTPIAVSGRVLAYTFENRELFKPGEAVCSGPNGTISKMTREEIRNWPDAIVGYVSEIPDYEKWGSNDIKVNERIWIKVH